MKRKKKSYYKPVRVSNFWNNNYIECGNNTDRNKTLSIEEYLNKIRLELKASQIILKIWHVESSINNSK